MRKILEGIEEVYHLAAAVGVALIASEPIRTIETNVYPTETLLAELNRRHREGQVLKIFLASTSEVYGKNPKPTWSEEDDLVFGSTTRARWSYGASKAIDEFLALAYWRQYRLPMVVGRFFNVVGPRQVGTYGMVVPRFVSAALSGGPLVVHDDGHQARCFCHVSDVVKAILALMACKNSAGEVFNIGSDAPVTILELAKSIISHVGSNAAIVHQSYSEAYSDDFEDVRCRVPDLSKLRRFIDFQPQYELSDIITETIDWTKGQSDRAGHRLYAEGGE